MTVKKTKARTRSRPRTASHMVVDRATVTVTPNVWDKIKAIAVWIGAVGLAVGLIWNFYGVLGLPKFVDSGTFHSTLEQVKVDVGNKLVATKTEVLTTANRNTEEVKSDVSGVKTQVDKIAQGQKQARIDQWELQQRVLFQQKSTLSNNLNGVEIQLRDPTKANDPFLLQRKSELQNLINITDRDFEAVAERIRRERQQ